MSTFFLMFLSYAALGLLIGSIAGLTSAAITTSLLAALFAFVGGSALAFLPKLNDQDRRLASSALAGLSLAATMSLYFSLYLREHAILSPTSRQAEMAGKGLLRSEKTSLDTSLIQQLQTGDIDLEGACVRREQKKG